VGFGPSDSGTSATGTKLIKVGGARGDGSMCSVQWEREAGRDGAARQREKIVRGR
jgi:hypothetical protein